MTDSHTGNHAVVLTAHREDVSAPPSQFLAIREQAPVTLEAGEIRVRNSHLMIAAVTGDLMESAPDLPMPPFDLDVPLWGNAVGTVIESRDDDRPVGTVVQHAQGWREEAVLAGAGAFPVPDGVFPGPEYVLNQGVTAYHGVVDVAQVRDGDVVFVTGAAGGVGSLAGQIAKRRGAVTVIGSAGGPDKCRFLVEELGFDVAIDYRSDDVPARLRELAPDGIDVLYDNVGGTQFEAAVQAAAEHARFALCGALAAQVGGRDALPRLDILAAILHEITIRPFRTLHTPEQIQAWNTAYARWFPAGEITFPHTVVEGDLHTAVAALDDLLDGAYRGQLIVALRSS